MNPVPPVLLHGSVVATCFGSAQRLLYQKPRRLVGYLTTAGAVAYSYIVAPDIDWHKSLRIYIQGNRLRIFRPIMT